MNAAFQTKWCVITGGPSSGKSSVINTLADMGFSIVPEVARNNIEFQFTLGKPIREIVANQLKFQRSVLKEMFKIEQNLDKNSRVFLDRGLPDGIAFYREANLNPKEVFELCKVYRYDKVFLFEQIPENFAEKDEIRIEDSAKSFRLEKQIEAAYLELNYDVLHVPFMAVMDRTNFLLNSLFNSESR